MVDIKDAANWLTVITGAIFSAFSWFFGGFDAVFGVFILFMFSDIITGLIVAGVNGKISSSVMKKGILKKCVFLLIVGLFSCLDLYIFNTNGIIRWALIIWMIGGEGVSILENAASLGLNLPKKLQEVLEVMQKKINDLDMETLANKDKED